MHNFELKFCVCSKLYIHNESNLKSSKIFLRFTFIQISWIWVIHVFVMLNKWIRRLNREDFTFRAAVFKFDGLLWQKCKISAQYFQNYACLAKEDSGIWC